MFYSRRTASVTTHLYLLPPFSRYHRDPFHVERRKIDGDDKVREEEVIHASSQGARVVAQHTHTNF